MKIGIFFGGPSREREISFVGGRTVYDNLDKALFTPVPIFVDSIGNFILLEWPYLYRGTIRDFYPPTDHISHSPFQYYIESLGTITTAEQDAIISRVGQRITPDQFASLFDFAFLTLHGPYGEDGTLQGLLTWWNIPYSGTGMLGAALGIDKAKQKPWMQRAGLATPAYEVLDRHAWETTPDKAALLTPITQALGWPIVVKSSCQGSSIGVSMVRDHDLAQLAAAIDRSFFIQEVTATVWHQFTPAAKQQWIASLIDLREGIGLPVMVHDTCIYHPEVLWQYLDQHFATADSTLRLASVYGGETVLLEAYIAGREFSCVVLEVTPGKPIALPPTEMVKEEELFDYRAKYLPGMVQKATPIQLPDEQLAAIRADCVTLFNLLHFQVYARIDGFIQADGTIYLNDPNTTSGMNPSSFLFHQAAEIGLNPTQLLTVLVRNSLATRLKEGKAPLQARKWLATVDQAQSPASTKHAQKLRVGVIMGGFSAERHVSVESGRNVYEKLASSTQYTPIPLFLAGTPAQPQLFVLPINTLLKDNADDIRAKLSAKASCTATTLMKTIRKEAAELIQKYAQGQALQLPQAVDYKALAQLVDFAFIALHGRPGEDGTIQAILEQHHIPYNGSGVQSTALTIDKFRTNQLLRQHDILVADQQLVTSEAWYQNAEALMETLSTRLGYPMIAKPVDEGCSAAVIKITDPTMLVAYAEAMFRKTPHLTSEQARTLGLTPQTAFPQKQVFLAESLITQGDATHFLEITGGLLTHQDPDGNRTYEMFKPSEAIAQGTILSLEEKFLAGEGQNITPARFHPDPSTNHHITQKVQQDLKRVAQLLDIVGYARIDAFVKIYDMHRVETWIIEVNSLPAMTPATCIFHQCALNGYTSYAFMHQIIQYGLQRHACNTKSHEVE